jgi:hypothetical protein
MDVTICVQVGKKLGIVVYNQVHGMDSVKLCLSV